MTSSRNCSNRRRQFIPVLILAGIACLLMLAGCATGKAPVAFNAYVPSWGPLIAVYPIENLSGAPAPLKALHEELMTILQQAGARIVDKEVMDSFLNRHWVRYVGGIDEKTANDLWSETGADAVLITSLELYNDQSPPRIALMTRLVSTNGEPEILWIDSFAKAGEDTPGLLGLGIIEDPVRVRQLALDNLEKSLHSYIINPPVRKNVISAREFRLNKPFSLSELVESIKEDKWTEKEKTAAKRPWYSPTDFLIQPSYNPKGWYRSGNISNDLLRTVAFIPFLDLSTRKRGAEVLVLHLAKQLVRDGRYKVLELGVIRDKMLSLRVIMTSGVSNANIDDISNNVGVDLIINGKLFDYLESNLPGQIPKVDFSLQMFERDSRKILWNSRSHNQGNDGVFFFDYGQLSTASALVDGMSRSTINRLFDKVYGK